MSRPIDIPQTGGAQRRSGLQRKKVCFLDSDEQAPSCKEPLRSSSETDSGYASPEKVLTPEACKSNAVEVKYEGYLLHKVVLDAGGKPTWARVAQRSIPGDSHVLYARALNHRRKSGMDPFTYFQRLTPDQQRVIRHIIASRNLENHEPNADWVLFDIERVEGNINLGSSEQVREVPALRVILRRQNKALTRESDKVSPCVKADCEDVDIIDVTEPLEVDLLRSGNRSFSRRPRRKQLPESLKSGSNAREERGRSTRIDREVDRLAQICSDENRTLVRLKLEWENEDLPPTDQQSSDPVSLMSGLQDLNTMRRLQARQHRPANLETPGRFLPWAHKQAASFSHKSRTTTGLQLDHAGDLPCGIDRYPRRETKKASLTGRQHETTHGYGPLPSDEDDDTGTAARSTAVMFDSMYMRRRANDKTCRKSQQHNLTTAPDVLTVVPDNMHTRHRTDGNYHHEAQDLLITELESMSGLVPLPTKACFFIILLGLLDISASLCFGVVWSIAKGSIGDGFTTASYILGVGAVTVGSWSASHWAACTCWSRWKSRNRIE